MSELANGVGVGGSNGAREPVCGWDTQVSVLGRTWTEQNQHSWVSQQRRVRSGRSEGPWGGGGQQVSRASVS